jgi:hypothetical protein
MAEVNLLDELGGEPGGICTWDLVSNPYSGGGTTTYSFTYNANNININLNNTGINDNIFGNNTTCDPVWITDGMLPGNYVFQYNVSNANGSCPASATLTVTVNETPVVEILNLPEFFCSECGSENDGGFVILTEVTRSSDGGVWNEVTDGVLSWSGSYPGSGLTNNNNGTFALPPQGVAHDCDDLNIGCDETPPFGCITVTATVLGTGCSGTSSGDLACMADNICVGTWNDIDTCDDPTPANLEINLGSALTQGSLDLPLNASGTFLANNVDLYFVLVDETNAPGCSLTPDTTINLNSFPHYNNDSIISSNNGTGQGGGTISFSVAPFQSVLSNVNLTALGLDPGDSITVRFVAVQTETTSNVGLCYSQQDFVVTASTAANAGQGGLEKLCIDTILPIIPN